MDWHFSMHSKALQDNPLSYLYLMSSISIIFYDPKKSSTSLWKIGSLTSVMVLRNGNAKFTKHLQ
jgi:hypothetical protein